MKVSEAVVARRSIRSFLDTPVSDEQISQLLKKPHARPQGATYSHGECS